MTKALIVPMLLPCAAFFSVLEPSMLAAEKDASAERVARGRVAKPRRAPGGKPFGTRKIPHVRSRPHPVPASAAPTPEEEEEHPQASDPIERVNRCTFALNQQVYRFVLKPLSRVTTFLVPQPALDAIGNVFDNLKSPVRISASLLQGNGRRAAQETGKLLVNSTVGIGGLWKASDWITKLKNVPEEDFGQTFGVWGIKPGPFIVVPVLGPRSLRDLVGAAADVCASPQTWVSAGNLNVWATVSDNVQRNPGRMQVYDDATKDALDPYVAVREGYTAYRENAVRR
jgi:phospholipid-binding lipoprotein MlaA